MQFNRHAVAHPLALCSVVYSMPGVWQGNHSYSRILKSRPTNKIIHVNAITTCCSHAVRTLSFQFTKIAVWVYTSAVNMKPAVANIAGNPGINSNFRYTTDWLCLFLTGSSTINLATN